MKMLSGEWLGPCHCQLDAFAAYLERAAIPEGLLRCRPGRVVVPQQEPSRFLVPDAHHVPVEQRGRAGVVRVVVRVDEMGHLVAHTVGSGDLVHGPPQVVADGRWCVEQHDAVPGGQERRVVGAVGDPVEVPLHASDVVALVVESGAARTGGPARSPAGLWRLERLWLAMSLLTSCRCGWPTWREGRRADGRAPSQPSPVGLGVRALVAVRGFATDPGSPRPR